jgi:hypothetical protein
VTNSPGYPQGQGQQPPQGWQPPPQQFPQQPQYGQPQQPYPNQPPPQYAPPPPPKKKSKAGKVLGIIVAVIVVLCGGGILIAALSSGGGGKSGSSGSPAVHAALNQPARDGKFEFTVSSVKCGVAKVGDEFLNKTAQGQFCEATMTVKNIGTEPQTFDGSNQKAKAADGTEYANDSEAELYANTATKTFLDQINPGNAVKGVVIFDIPKGAKIATLELHDSIFSGGVIVTVG